MLSSGRVLLSYCSPVELGLETYKHTESEDREACCFSSWPPGFLPTSSRRMQTAQGDRQSQDSSEGGQFAESVQLQPFLDTLARRETRRVGGPQGSGGTSGRPGLSFTNGVTFSRSVN